MREYLSESLSVLSCVKNGSKFIENKSNDIDDSEDCLPPATTQKLLNFLNNREKYGCRKFEGSVLKWNIPRRMLFKEIFFAEE